MPQFPSTDSASGIWSLKKQKRAQQGSNWPLRSFGDFLWNYVTALFKTTSTNAAQNNTFRDSSTNNFTITRNGNTTQGTFTPYGSNWSNYFSGSVDSLQIASNAAFVLDTDFTLEAWVFPTASANQCIIGMIDSGGVANWDLYLLSANTARIRWLNTSGTIHQVTSAAITLNQWVHIAVTLSGTTLTLYVNGVSAGSTTVVGSARTISRPIGIGRPGDYAGEYFTGYISNLRYVRGSVVYTTNFTPPIAPLTAITNTSLLTCQSNRFIDNSTNARTLTTTGSPSVQRFSPLAQTVAYSTAATGGSGYFDGNGDYLSLPNNTALDLASGDFTAECWFYVTSVAAARPLFGRNNGNIASPSDLQYGLYLQSGGNVVVRPYQGGTDYTMVVGTAVVNAWNHVALVRTGNTFYGFLNGVRGGTSQTISGSLNNGAWLTYIGGGLSSGLGNDWMLGYIGDTRVVKGTALYTGTTYTIPSAPLTAIANTSLLLNYTNAGIFDSAATNDIETAGNAQVSTTQAKFGGTSMYFDGTGDWVITPNGPQFNLSGSGNFTIEGWIYNSGAGQYRGIIGARQNGITQGWCLYVHPNNTLYMGSIIVGNSYADRQLNPIVIPANTWTHVALVKTSGGYTGFVNGVPGSLIALTGGLDYQPSQPLIVGALGSQGEWPFLGYIDDMRITRGYARYWYRFTPPAATFSDYYEPEPILASDPLFNYTTLLLPGNGTNGAQNNNFIDSSSNNFTITRNGNATQGTFTPHGVNWSNFFGGGNGDYVAVADNGGLDFGTGDFTIELWFNPSRIQGSTIVSGWTTSGVVNGWAIGIDSTSVGMTSANNDSYITASISAPIVSGNWYHFAAVRSGGSFKVFLNGVGGSAVTNNQTIDTQSAGMFIGRSTYNPNPATYQGYVSNLRVVKGTALYSSDFTPSTTPLSVVSGTSLLTCQSNCFIDNSGNALAITPNGTSIVQRYSPFNPPASYSAATSGGSAYFDGSGDFLTWTGTAAGSGAFSYEFWIYSTNGFGTMRAPLGVIATSGYNSALDIRMTGSTINVSQYNVANNNFTVPALQANTWYHIVACRNASNQTTVFVNGVRSSTGAITLTTNFSGLTSAIGRLDPSNGGDVTGYISGVRLITGSTPYDPTQTTITVPTAPPTTITNTQFLANFTNGGIIDNTMMGDFETVGGVQINTSVSKFGGGSISFDGSTGNLVAPYSPNYSLDTADFTVEGWFYFTNLGTNQRGIVGLGDGANGSGPIYNAWSLQYLGSEGSNQLRFYRYDGTEYLYATSGLTLVANTWTHIAVSRGGGVLRIFVDGVPYYSAANSQSFAAVNTNPLRVALQYYGPQSGYGGPRYWPGHIDDLRITKGVARYVQPFSVPTRAHLTA